MKKISINIPNYKYEIYIQKGLLTDIYKYIEDISSNSNIAVITDENVYRLYGKALAESFNKKSINIYFIVLKAGEKSKSIETLMYIYSKLAEYKINRSDLIIAFGGGVVGDVAGFAASTYLRGIPYIQIPTTLLAQVDSSVGGKTAIDIPEGKNLVGSFYQPKRVLIDTELLKTLSDKNMKDGMGEVIKYACIYDKSFFEYLSRHKLDTIAQSYEEIVYNCCNIKKAFVEADERDNSIRMILNFGHTIAHALECYYNYELYTHGEAVAIGMYTITKNSEAMGMTKPNNADKIKNILENYHIAYNMPKIDNTKLIELMKNDKKHISDTINLILLDEIGKAYISKVKIEEIAKML